MAKKPAAQTESTPTAPPQIRALVDKFAEYHDDYTGRNYNELSLRHDFLNPFFEALGWDVANRAGYSEAYRDVILEPPLEVERSVRAPDYCFRISETPKFFVEAKRPSVDIATDIAPAFQLRRYAWTRKLALSILTDFEEFAVYDCRVKPDAADKAATARVMLLKYTDYVERWPEIASVFSREAILRGSFDQYAESNKKKRGTAPVDEEFLKEIEDWRELLAKNICLRNPDIDDRQLNTAVQLIIDRIIFLRMCEGRRIEEEGRLQTLANGDAVYPRLVEMFHHADDKYNSGLFHFEEERGREQPDTLTTELAIDDKVLKQIIKRLYYPCPYEFSAMPADILGQVYEQFLGKVIRITPGHQAKIEEKPEVRKSGGVYYTPTYIVDYIVENTVGKLVEGKTPQEVGGLTAAFKESKTARPLSVLDPACGSGSFLIVAYQYLLDWYLKQYTEQSEPKTHARGANPRIYQVVAASPDRATGDWRLTTAERKRILLAHIYGVDIDYQAVEVTKLSLLLKALEGETKESLQRMLLQRERALPDLAKNIRCGNSLIGRDFYNGQQRSLLDEGEEHRINVFDWSGEAGFPEILQSGGFDAVIGNPPYIRMETFKELKTYLRSRYKVHEERTDLYAYFIEREHQLLRDGGMFGMIVSNKFLRANYGRKVRALISDLAQPLRIIDLAGLPVFRGATVRTIVLITQRGTTRARTRYSPPPDRESFKAVQAKTVTLAECTDPNAYVVPATAVKGAVWNLMKPNVAALMQKLEIGAATLKEISSDRICRGIVSGLNEAFVITQEQMQRIVKKNSRAKKIIHPFIQGRCIERYNLVPSDEYLIYTHHGIDMKPYPAVLDHLSEFRKELENRATDQPWYELQQPQFAYKEWMESPKIVFPDIATSCRFALDREGHFGANTVYFIPSDDLQLLGLLNSRLADFYFRQVCAALEGPGEAYLRFFGQYLEPFPVRLPKSSMQQALLVRLVEEISLLQRQAAVATGHSQIVKQRILDGAEDQLDRLVYELYALSDEEIKIVEDATK